MTNPTDTSVAKCRLTEVPFWLDPSAERGETRSPARMEQMEWAMHVPTNVSMPSVSTTRDPPPFAEATARVVESTVDLARAEGRLALTHASRLARHAVTSLLLVIVAAALLQVTVLSIALAPLLSNWLSGAALTFLVLVPALATATASYVAARTWRTAARSLPGAEQREEESQ